LDSSGRLTRGTEFGDVESRRRIEIRFVEPTEAHAIDDEAGRPDRHASVGRGPAKGASWMHKMYEGEDEVRANALLTAPPLVINIGLELFAENLASQGAQVVHVRWSPPAGGNSQLANLLAKLRS
jgi:hypothetical protein